MEHLTVNRTSWVTYRDVLAERKPFRTNGSLRGQGSYSFERGRLPEPWATEYRERHEHIDYVVYSYSTPLAWHDIERGWIMPDAKYSVTTSKQQGRIAPGITALREGFAA